MRFFMLYSNQFAVGNKPIGIASLAAILKRAGHEFELFDCTQFRLLRDESGADSDNDWNLAGAKTIAFKEPMNPELLPAREPIGYRALVERLIARIDAFKPDIIGLSALTDDFPLGLGLMRAIKPVFPSIPTIVGGVHATVDPEGVLREECFDMVCVGEGEYVVLNIGERIDHNKPFDGVDNLWIKKPDGSIERNSVRPYEQDLDKFPVPDWSIFPDTSFYKPFLGVVYKYGDFEMSRGCPYKCSYCINVQLQEIYRFAGSHNYHREKTIPRVISEISAAVEEYGIEFLKFWDETFLLMSQERMEEFRDLYADLRLPYVIETTGQSLTPFSAKILQDTNCKSASLGMETGSPDMRKGMLSKPVDNDVYLRAFDLMEQHGIQKVSFNMIGLPGESPQDIFRTIALNRLVGTETQSVGIFYPYKGTPIRNMLIKQGLLDNDFEYHDLRDYDFNTFTAGNRSVVRFKDMDSRLLNRLWMLFSSYCFWPVRLFPLIDYVKDNDDPFAVTLLNNIQDVTYHRKFGDWPSERAAEGAASASADEQPATPPVFGDPDIDSFVQLISGHWRGPGYNKLIQLLSEIAAGTLTPQVEIPEDHDELADWLDISGQTKDESRLIRAELRQMAQSNSKSYDSGTYAAE